MSLTSGRYHAMTQVLNDTSGFFAFFGIKLCLKVSKKGGRAD